MVQVNLEKQELNCKLVYCGPPGAGKTSSLEAILQRLPVDQRAKLTSLPAESGRAFDYLSFDLGRVGGLRTRFHVYAVPERGCAVEARRMVLRGVDGVVFVADSDPARAAENARCLAEVEEDLREQGLDPAQVVRVLQWNKRDLPGGSPVKTLAQALNPAGAPVFEASARTGDGVLPVLKRAALLVLQAASREYGFALEETRRVRRPARESARLRSEASRAESKPATVEPAVREVKGVAPAGGERRRGALRRLTGILTSLL